MTPEEVKEYWTRQAETYGDSYGASWTDRYAMELEEKKILDEICGTDILDVGCANGFKTMSLARKIVKRFVATDYIPEMIQKAIEKYEATKEEYLSRIEFKVGNILDIKEESNFFDTVLVTRVLINLDSEDQQKAAIKECARVLKPNGRLVVSEATVQGWKNMNALRACFSLPPIPMPPFNHYLDENTVLENCEGLFRHDTINFSSTYFLGTRVLKPMLKGVDVADPNSEINRLFSQLPAWGDYGTQKMFVFEKV